METTRKGFFKSLFSYKIEREHWAEFKEQLAERLKKPWGYPEFILYFIVVVCIIGSVGIITSFASESINSTFNHKNLTLNIGTSFIAVVASAAADLIMTGDEVKTKVFRIIGIVTLLICIGLFWLTNIFSSGWSYYPSCLGLFIALTTWWIANANSPHLTRQRVPKNAVPDVPISLPGDASKFDL